MEKVNFNKEIKYILYFYLLKGDLKDGYFLNGKFEDTDTKE